MGSPDRESGTSANNWDWEKGKRTIVQSIAPKEEDLWQEEAYAAPDGESFAAVVRLEDESFTLRVNDGRWEETFEKVWYPRFAPDGRLTALVMADDEWTVAVDGEAWEERFAFAWATTFGPNGAIAASVQQDMRYACCLNGAPWENMYENAQDYCFSADGKKTAGVVQVKSLKQADLDGFRSGIFTVAVDGEAWDQSFMNVWTPVFDGRDNERVAAQARLNAYDYTIVVNGEPWAATYNCVWEPVFNPATGVLAAPVRQGGRWGVAFDAAMNWPASLYQCWGLQWSRDGKNLWAVVAPEYGKFTVACNNKPWAATFPVVTELALSPDGTRAAALACHANKDYKVVVDGKPWQGSWDMAWQPVFSPDGAHVAALVEKGGKKTYLVNNLPLDESFTEAWTPAFSPDSSSLLLRGVQNNALVRVVLPLKDIH
ncbi:WD40 repeat domain-containing protein [Desulfovibrio sp. OttesenSCG-928-A18]|nr:WD40 repeat domain-containing protein [Desulfovibrio sp. OttesenSCG-928-A18]